MAGRLWKGLSVVGICILIGLMISGSSAFAQTPTTDEPTITAGVTPDSWLYGLDVAIDQISLLLTFDNGAKARKGLETARERLLEVKEMVEENKLDAAGRAQNEHANVLGTVTSAVGGIEIANSTQEIEEEIEIEKELEEHEKEILTIKDELTVKIKIKGEATEEQQALIDSILNSLENKAGKVKIEIDNKKGRTKIKIKQQRGMSAEEIEEEIDEIEEKKGLTRIRLEWAQKAIEHAEEKIATAQEKINEKRAEGVNVTIAENYLSQANTLLAQAKDSLNATEYRDARKLAKEAGKLAMHAKRGKSFVEIEEIKVKAEVVGNVTQAKVRVKFMSTTTEREILANEILNKLKLDKETISNLLEIEIGEEKELKERLKAEVKIKEGTSKVKATFEFTLNTTNRDEIVDGAYEKLSALTIEDITNTLEIEAEERELEIEVEIEEGKAEVEIEIDGADTEFTLDTTSRDEIIAEIASRTGLTIEEIEQVIEFKEKVKEEKVELEKALKKINKTKEKLMKLQEKGVDVSKALEELTRIETEFKEGLFVGDLEEALESVEEGAKAKKKEEE